MSPFKFVRCCGHNATAEAVESKLLLLKSRAPVFEQLGISVAASLPPYPALASSAMASESVLAGPAVGQEDALLRGDGYVAPALRPSSFVGTHGWNALQLAAGNATATGPAADGEVELQRGPEEMRLPTPPPPVANVRMVLKEEEQVGRAVR